MTPKTEQKNVADGYLEKLRAMTLASQKHVARRQRRIERAKDLAARKRRPPEPRAEPDAPLLSEPTA